MLNATQEPPIGQPTEIEVVCEADGQPSSGLLVLLTLKADSTNDHNLIVGPSDSSGRIEVPADEIRGEVERTTRAFPADYAGLDAFSGLIVVEPMDLAEIGASLDAYDLFHASIPYPTGHSDRLRMAWTLLYQQAPRRLSVTAKASPRTGLVRLVTVDKSNPGPTGSP